MEIPKELLSKEFLSQFKSEEYVSKFLTTLHSRVLKQMPEGEMDAYLGYEKHSVSGINTGNSRNGKYPKRFKPSMVNPV
nr:transposase [Parabacteroides goldsteinii]